MIVISHRMTSHAWEFDATPGDLRGGGETLGACVAASEDAAREYLVAVGRHPVLHGDVADQVRHDVDAAVLTA